MMNKNQVLGLYLFIFSILTPFVFANSSLKGQWIDAAELQPGMKVLTQDNKRLTVASSWQQQSKPTKTYNFTIAKAHTYFISDHGLWVHNMCDKVGKVADPNVVAANEGMAGYQGITKPEFDVIDTLTAGTKELKYTDFGINKPGTIGSIIREEGVIPNPNVARIYLNADATASEIRATITLLRNTLSGTGKKAIKLNIDNFSALTVNEVREIAHSFGGRTRIGVFGGTDREDIFMDIIVDIY